MKILCVSLNHTPEQTGIGKYQGEMVAWLVAKGHQVHVITAPPYYPEWKLAAGYSSWRYKREQIAGAFVMRVPLYVPAQPSGLKRLIHLASFALAAKPILLWQALTWRPDVIMATAPPLSVAPAVVFVSWISGARSHLHVQDFEVEAAFQLGILKRPLLFQFALGIERWLLRSFTRVSTISQRMQERLVAKGVAAERTVLIPNWAGVEDFGPPHDGSAWRKKLGADDTTVVALYAGNMGRKQGLEIIVEACALLQKQPHIVFVICGDGAGRAEMVASAKGLANIVFLPVQPFEEFTSMMLAADIHLLPQRSEAADLVMPSKVGNILASGKPVIACAKEKTQIYDAVQGCGIVVEPEQADQFAAAIATLAGDAALRKAMGARGRERALAEWSRNSILERMEACLRGDAI